MSTIIKPLLLPIVAYSAFVLDYPNLTTNVQRYYYYAQQCSMKELFGINAKIKFI